MEEVSASTFILPQPSARVPVRALWEELASDLASARHDEYAHDASWGYRICALRETCLSPDRSIVRYRTVEASIRRKSGKPTLIDVSVGNLFSSASAPRPIRMHGPQEPKYARWWRQVGRISLADHLRMVGQFRKALHDRGCILEPARLQSFQLALPRIRNARGVLTLPVLKRHVLARSMMGAAESDLEFAVVASSRSLARWGAEQVSLTIKRLFGSQRDIGLRRLRAVSKMCPSAVNLCLLNEADNFAELSDLREQLRVAEAEGHRFKLARRESLSDRFSAANIVYDMFHIGGAKWWLPSEPQRPFCSIDAGHDVEQRKSRWVRVESDENHTISSVSVHETDLAEHLPRTLVDDLWPSNSSAILCRDGRMAQERDAVQARAAREQRSVIEVKKSPKAILWRSVGSNDSPAQVGDAVVDEHGEILVQSMPQDMADYVRPLRLSTRNDNLIELATEFMRQHAMPGLSLYRMSRLPGSLYFADLVSKFTANGWPKAIGRGFRIPQIIP